MKVRLFGLAMGALILGLAGNARSETFTIGVENIEYYPAYSFEDGEYKGFARALLDAFAKDRGHNFDYRPLPVGRLYSTFLQGDLDFKFPDNATWAGDQKAGKTVIYSDRVFAYVDGVSVLSAQKGRPADTVKSLGIVRGFTAWDWLDRIKAGTLTLHENSSFRSLLLTTIAGRNEGAFGNIDVIHYQLEKIGQPGALVFDPGLPHTKGYYHLSSMKHPALLSDFNAWMAANTNLLIRLKADYGIEKLPGVS